MQKTTKTMKSENDGVVSLNSVRCSEGGYSCPLKLFLALENSSVPDIGPLPDRKKLLNLGGPTESPHSIRRLLYKEDVRTN